MPSILSPILPDNFSRPEILTAMEKIININMAGRIIAIEDGAYSLLKSYIESLHRYFAAEEGRDEIINDIESRVAELMEEAIKSGGVAVTEADVSSIIGSIGRVEDFAAADSDEPATGHIPFAQASTKKSKRFYRDTNDKIAGGVCSGLAAYMNVDPALIRIVFAILTLGGWGAGLLLYVALWIFVPAAPLESFRGRRLFRDEEDKWLGGVCSGIAAYFDKEVWIFRLLFALPFLLSIFSGSLGFFTGAPLFFGSFTGTFILIYIVLWVVLPVATTDFQKMEMRGEKIDLASISSNIKDRAKSFGAEVSQSASRLSGEAASFINTRSKGLAREATAAARPMATRGGEVIGTLSRAFFFFIGSALAFSLFMILIGYSFSGFSGLMNDYILRTPAQRTFGWATVILFLGVPLLALVTFMVRRGLRVRSGGRYFAWGYGVLWVAGIICLATLAASVSKDFRRIETVETEVPVIQPATGKLIVTVPDEPVEYGNSLPWLHGDIRGWDISDDAMRSARVLVLTALSRDSLYHVIVRRSAMGPTDADAAGKARLIDYPLRSASDSVIQLPNGYDIRRGDGYRAQYVVVEVQVPAGGHIRFDASVEDKLVSFNVPFRQRNRHGRKSWQVGWSGGEQRQDWESDVDYVMNINGELVNEAPQEDIAAVMTPRTSAVSEIRANRRLDSLDRALKDIERQREKLREELAD